VDTLGFCSSIWTPLHSWTDSGGYIKSNGLLMLIATTLGVFALLVLVAALLGRRRNEVGAGLAMVGAALAGVALVNFVLVGAFLALWGGVPG
jgi:hypothetical protein